jgi:hypothetical protein
MGGLFGQVRQHDVFIDTDLALALIGKVLNIFG